MARASYGVSATWAERRAPWELGGVEPLMPTVETTPAAHIAAIVSARRRRGLSQPM